MLESKCPLSLSSLPAKELCHAIKWLFHTLSQLHPLTLPTFHLTLTKALNSLWNWKIEEKQIIFTPSSLPAHVARVCSAQLPVTNSGLSALRLTSSLNLRTVLLVLPLFSLASLSFPHWSFSLYPEVQLPSQERNALAAPSSTGMFFASMKGLFLRDLAALALSTSLVWRAGQPPQTRLSLPTTPTHTLVTYKLPLLPDPVMEFQPLH